MAKRVCPFWIGYLLLNPVRKLFENPDRILGPFVREGMTILEPGCGMGYFTLPLAKMVGRGGRVIAVDLQPKMLSVVRKRALKAGLHDRIALRQAEPGSLCIQDLDGQVDFVAALHMVHELPDAGNFFREVWNALKPHGRVLVIEPQGHVAADQFRQSIAAAEKIGFTSDRRFSAGRGRKILLLKPSVG